MSDAARTPEEGIANAIHDLSDQTGTLVRQELDALKEEMLSKAKQWTPAMGLLALAGAGGLFAVASSYRLLIKLIDGLLPKGIGVVAAPALFGGLSFLAAQRAVRQMKDDAPIPVPTETIKEVTEQVKVVVQEQKS